MTENTAYVYRLYPTDEQVVLFRRTFGCCRKVWNLMLADRTGTQNSARTHVRKGSAMQLVSRTNGLQGGAAIRRR